MTERVQDQFTQRVPVYDRRSAWILDPGLLGAVVDACRVPEGGALLDVCCGTGAVGAAFRGRAGRLAGLDLTPAMLEQARTRLDEVHEGTAYALPFPDASFDAVVSRQALHFLDSPARAVAEMHRVLRPGGQVVLAQRVPYGPIDAPFMEEVNRLKQVELRTFIRDDHLVDALQRASFDALSYTQYLLWESIDDWVASPEVTPERAAAILHLYRTAPPWIRAVHPVEVAPDGAVRARWRWAIHAAWKRA